MDLPVASDDDDDESYLAFGRINRRTSNGNWFNKKPVNSTIFQLQETDKQGYTEEGDGVGLVYLNISKKCYNNTYTRFPHIVSCRIEPPTERTMLHIYQPCIHPPTYPVTHPPYNQIAFLCHVIRIRCHFQFSSCIFGNPIRYHTLKKISIVVISCR